MIPCIENKCILLPICKSRTIIKCFIMLDFINHASPPVWDHILKVLPNAALIALDRKDY